MSLRQLSQIWIYPIKSLGGISVMQADVLPKGLRLDRRWMLVDEHNKFLTQRAHPLMSLFKPEMDQKNLVIHFFSDRIDLPTDLKDGTRQKAQVWDDMIDVTTVGDHFDTWFSERLNMKCRLVQFPEENPRPVDAAYSVNNDQVSLADGYPFLLIGQSSLDDLNSRLEKAVPIKRFRPNFVFTGGDPYEEDEWKEFTIGQNRFIGVKPCSRCVMTTINTETGEKGSEPLKTLSTYRRKNNKIYFGQNVIALNYTSVSVGDSIQIF